MEMKVSNTFSYILVAVAGIFVVWEIWFQTEQFSADLESDLAYESSVKAGETMTPTSLDP